MRSVSLLVLSLSIVMSPAHAWYRSGHYLTAEIAFDLLSEERQQQVAAILHAHPRFSEDFAAAMPGGIKHGSESEKALWLFERASTWPDIVRHVSEAARARYHRSSWHYIDWPVYLTDEDENALAGTLDINLQMRFDPPLRQNLNMVQALKGNLLVWRNESATDADRAVALCWVLHLTGDMHQPLHNVALFSRAYYPRGDYGGSAIAVRRGNDVTTLHVVWDSLPDRIEHLSPDEKTVALLANDVVGIESIDGWSRQHYEMAMEFAYTEEVKLKLLKEVSHKRNPEISLTREYISTASMLASQQLIIAGHRIAALISN